MNNKQPRDFTIQNVPLYSTIPSSLTLEEMDNKDQGLPPPYVKPSPPPSSPLPPIPTPTNGQSGETESKFDRASEAEIEKIKQQFRDNYSGKYGDEYGDWH